MAVAVSKSPIFQLREDIEVMKRRLIIVASALFAMTFAMHASQAQTASFDRPIRIISPFAAGSVSDVTLRLLADRLSPRLKTGVVIENMPTGGGIVAARTVLSAPADGHTLALLSNATAVTVATFKSLPFDPVKDFVPVGGISEFAYLLLSNEQSGFQNFRDFVTAAKAKPGTLNVGTAAPGTTPHLMAVLLKKEAGIDFTIVPFRGASDLTVALMRNDINVFINAYGAVRESLKQKKIRAIATTTAQRFKLLPDVPTVQEQGLPGFEVASWNGLFARAGAPPAVLDQIGKELRAVLTDPEMGKKLLELGVEVWASDSDQLASRMKSEIVRWNRAVQEAGIERK
jgi:tripartite-type tricarboxylate transporter receptor subunit TctC